MAAFLIVNFDVDDPAMYKDYQKGAVPSLGIGTNAKVVAYDTASKQVEGQGAGHQTARRSLRAGTGPRGSRLRAHTTPVEHQQALEQLLAGIKDRAEQARRNTTGATSRGFPGLGTR